MKSLKQNIPNGFLDLFLYKILFIYFPLFSFQETAKSPKTAPMSPDDMDDVESPALQVQPPGRRRGAISAEPIREEDIESYVKKVTR